MNTTDSRVELVADLAQLEGPAAGVGRVRETLGDVVRIVVASERSQLRNRETAIERLAARLDAAAHRAPPRRATRPSRGAVESRLEAKRARADVKTTRRPPDATDP